jgi:hypothetical protein
MAENPNRNSRIQYIWPWIGLAGVIALMWIFLAE